MFSTLATAATLGTFFTLLPPACIHLIIRKTQTIRTVSKIQPILRIPIANMDGKSCLVSVYTCPTTATIKWPATLRGFITFLARRVLGLVGAKRRPLRSAGKLHQLQTMGRLKFGAMANKQDRFCILTNV